jgi:disulfide bond formation protein DsbB
MSEAMKRFFQTFGLYFAWIVSVIATGGSLFFSEVLGFIPCTLCWFQRIFMYPLVIVLGIASYRDDRGIIPYVIPLTTIGGCFSLYHYLEQKVPAFAMIAPSCTVGVPCSQEYINWLGFITIPFMALVAFILITLFLLFARQRKQSANEESGL